jgi:hypothetical protein
VLERISDGLPGFDRAPLARIHFELGDLYRQTNNVEAALQHLRLVSTSKGSSPDLDREAAAIIKQLTQAQAPETTSR